MYEQSGRYYAFFGPTAQVTREERRFFERWTAGRHRVLDLGAGLCGPATMLARLGLEVLAFEPGRDLALLAMDRLNRGDEAERSITLIEGSTDALPADFNPDVILLRSVLMLLGEDERAALLATARRLAAPGARLICDVRTAALAWADEGKRIDERALGHTLFRRITKYSRDIDGSTSVDWLVQAQRFGRTWAVAQERFTVRADSAQGLRELLRAFGFELQQLYGAYDLEQPYDARSTAIIAVAELV